MSIKGALGETLRTSLMHFTPAQIPITGATFTTLVANRPDDSVFPVTYREIGGGVYEATVVTTTNDVPGEWFFLCEANNGYRYEETFDIIGDRPATVHVPTAPQAGATRQQLRRAIALMMGDFILVTASANGDESMVIDTVGLARETNAFNGSQIYCSYAQAPTNVGKVGTIVSNNTSASSVNFQPSLPFPVRAGDQFEIYNYRDTGWRIDEYNRAINDTIMRGGQEHGTLPVVEVVQDAFDYATNVALIPQDFMYFSGVDVANNRGHYQSVPYRYYKADRFTGEVTFIGPWGSRVRGRTFRFRGHKAPELLHTDDAMTSMASEWVIHDVMATLLGGDVSTGTGQGVRDRMFNMERQGADGRRPTIVTTYAPNTIKMMRG